jgi:hypothetical protein
LIFARRIWASCKHSLVFCVDIYIDLSVVAFNNAEVYRLKYPHIYGNLVIFSAGNLAFGYGNFSFAAECSIRDVLTFTALTAFS